MRNNIRYPLIVAIILLLSILLLPGISATRKGIKPTANDKSAWNHDLVRAGRFLIASLLEDDEDPPFADLIVTKTASSEQVAAGSDLTYTIQVRNGGAEVAADVTMSDPLPQGMTFVSVTEPAGWTCSTPAVGDGGTVTCTNPSLSVTSGDLFTLVVNVPSEVEPGTFFSNTATVSTTSLDPNDENNSSTAAVMVPAAGSVNVGVTKTASSEKVNAGSDLTYTIVVRNGGPEAADSVTLGDTLPGNMTFVSVTEPAGWTCSTPAVGDGGTVICTNESLAVTSGDLFTLVAHVPSDTPLGAIYTNTATVSTSTPDSNSEDDSSTVSTETASADLSVTKVDAPDPVTAGDNLTYTITVNNAGPSTPSASLSDTLPANTSFVSISAPGGWFCNSPAVGAGGTVSCFNPEFGKGSSSVFTLTVATSPSLTAGTIISNTATVSSTTPDPNPGNESATATTAVLSPATLSGTKTVSGQFTPGGHVSYTVVITNNGPAAQGDNPGNEFTDVLPASLTLVSATATSGTATVGANTVAWNGSVPNGGSVTITIQATIKSDTEGATISNQGTISYDADGNGTNETSAVTDDPVVAGSSDPTSFVVHTVPTLSINNVSVTEGNSGTKDATFTVTLSASSSQAVTVDYQTANGTATAPSDYQSTSGTLTFETGELTKTITVLINGDTVNEVDETFTVNLTNPQNATLVSANAGTGTILNDDSPGVRLGSDSYTVSEAASHFTITVVRTGDLSGAASVDYETSDLSGLNNCDVVTGNASQRCDYTAVAGTLNFIAGQSSITFGIPIIDDVYVEGPETFTLTLHNPNAGGNLGTPSTATLTITDNDASPGAPNPIDDDTFFIRQQYLDILGREPDAPGLAGWLDFLHSCTAGSTDCDRVELSSRFFRSAEFFDRAYFIYRFYEAGLGRKPTYDEYQSDFAKVAGFLTSAELEARKAAFAEEFSQRSEFKARYDSKADGDEYVNAIVATAGVTPSNRTSVAGRQGSHSITRGQALRELLESPEISQHFFNEAFVVVGYFAYLRRDPDAQYLVWLNQLNTTGDYREMIRGFMQSPEYRSRFGPVAP